jgi:hypothetical protein
VVFVIVAEGQLARMAFGDCRGGRLPTRSGNLVAGLCRAVRRRLGFRIGLQHGLRGLEIAPQIVLEIIEREALTQIVARAPKLAHPSSQHAREFGKPLRPKDEKRHDQNQSEFLYTDSKHVIES